MKRFGYAKGALSKAAEEAILWWISMVEREFEEGPMRVIDGLLSDTNIDSVNKIKNLGLLSCKNVPD